MDLKFIFIFLALQFKIIKSRTFFDSISPTDGFKHELYNSMLRHFSEEDSNIELFPNNSESDSKKKLSFHDFLFPLLIALFSRSTCGPWGTCLLRCGEKIENPPYVCSCDKNCLIFNDCCKDVNYYCVIPSAKHNDDYKDYFPSEEIEFEDVHEDADEQYEINMNTLKCKQSDSTTSYGYWYIGANITNRKCVMKPGPAWCHEPPGKEIGIKYSLAILLNFGPPGWQNNLLYNKDYYNPDKCKEEWEVYDPFANLCRPMECNPEYVIENGKCVIPDGQEDTRPTHDLIGYQSSAVNLSLFGDILLNSNHTNESLVLINEEFTNALSTRIRVNSSRILDVSAAPIENEEEECSPTTVFTTSSTTEHEFSSDFTDSTEQKSTRNSSSTETSSTNFRIFSPFEDEDEGKKRNESNPYNIPGIHVAVNFTLTKVELSNDTSTKEKELCIEAVIAAIQEAAFMKVVLELKQSNYSESNGSDQIKAPVRLTGFQKWISQEEIAFFETWCREGDVASYWNEEVNATFVALEEDIIDDEGEWTNKTIITLSVEVLSTGEVYQEGQFIANVLSQSFDLTSPNPNISGVFIVCENRPRIEDRECHVVHLNKTEFTWDNNLKVMYYNGEMKGLKKMFNRSEYEHGVNEYEGLIRVCINPEEAKNYDLIKLDPLLWEKMVSWLSFRKLLNARNYYKIVLMVISLLSLAGVVITYLTFPELRTLPGWCLLHYSASQFLFFLIFVAVVSNVTRESAFVCSLTSTSIHFFTIKLFTWSSIIAYDLHATFSQFQTEMRTKEKHLWRYIVIGYLTPTLFSIGSLVAELLFQREMKYESEEMFHYEASPCFIGDWRVSLALFAFPMGVSIVLNICLFFRIVRTLNAMSKTIYQSLKEKRKSKLAIYLRMSTLLGFGWIIGFVAVGFQWNPVTAKVLAFLFEILNSLQGVYIFMAFVTNRRTRMLYSNVFSSNCKRKKSGIDPPRGRDIKKSSDLVQNRRKTPMRTSNDNFETTLSSSVSDSSEFSKP